MKVKEALEIGQVLTANCGVDFEVIGITTGSRQTRKTYTVVFLDETRHEVTAVAGTLRSGAIANPNMSYDIRRKYNLGDILPSKTCGLFEVTDIQPFKVTVTFLDTGYEMDVKGSQINSGSINDPMARNVAGVGYMGVGRHKSRFPGEGIGKENPAHMTWTGIMGRCYIKDEIMYPRYGGKGAIVGESWHDFQNFADWYESNIPPGSGLQVDKDIIVKGNMLYSEQTCVAVPSYINSIFKKNPAGKSLMGTYKDKKGLGYKATLKVDGKAINLGYFRQELDAHRAWQTAKVGFIYEMINRYEVEASYNTRVKVALLGLAEDIQQNLESRVPTFLFTS